VMWCRFLALALSYCFADANQYDVFFPRYLPPAECTQGCARWADVAADGVTTPTQAEVNALFADGAVPSSAGSSCLWPGAAPVHTENRRLLRSSDAGEAWMWAATQQPPRGGGGSGGGRPPAGSCEKFGCGAYKKGGVCQCNDSCDRYHDCCPDFHQLCNGTTPPHKPPRHPGGRKGTENGSVPFCFCQGGGGGVSAHCTPPMGVPEQINLQYAAPDTVVAAFVTFEVAPVSAISVSIHSDHQTTDYCRGCLCAARQAATRHVR
jgi:hypothetical protein